MGKLRNEHRRLTTQAFEIEREAKKLLAKANGIWEKAKELESQFHTPLQRAIKARDREAALDLIKSGADTSALGSENRRYPLSMAVSEDMKQVVFALLKAGVDPNLFDSKQDIPPLASAIRWNQWTIAIALLQAGANPTIKIGRKSLEKAVEESRKENNEMWFREPYTKNLKDIDRFLDLLPEARRKYDKKLIASSSAPGKPGKKRDHL